MGQAVMPCLDGREREWAIIAERCSDAKTALLCGIINADKVALGFAEIWHECHSKIDALRKTVEYDSQNPEIGKLQDREELILLAAYDKLCVKK